MMDNYGNRFIGWLAASGIGRMAGLLLIVHILIWCAGVGQMPVAAAEAGSLPDVFENQHSRPLRIWVGEKYSQVFTNEMAEEIAAWVLEAYPDLPFSDPHVEIHEDGIKCSGVVEILGIDVAASGRVSVFLEGGKVNGRIEEIHVAGIQMPGLLMGAIDDVRGLYDEASWDIVVTKVELREGEMLVEGDYR